MAAAGVPTAGYTVVRDVEAGLAAIGALPRRAQGRRARRGQGRRDRRRRGRGARGARGDARRAALRRRSGRGRGVPGGRRAVRARAVRRRDARSRSLRRATSSASARATPAPTPAAWAPTRRSRAPTPELIEDVRVRVLQPVVDELARRGDAVPRRALRGADAHRRTARRCSSSTSASAIRRPRPCCRGCAATCSTCCSARSSPAACAGAELEWDARAAVTVVLASRGYPASLVLGRRHQRPRGRPAGAEVTHAGTAERDGAIVTAGGRVLNVTALGEDREAARAGRVCCRGHDHFRRQDLPPGHRRMSEPATETEVEPSWRASRSTPRASASSWAPSPTCRRWRRRPRS